ncbi:hypothetical protein Tco_0024814 [Tanacetum coccineum]|uniref:Uncharacterized protein n=1 Tax=Tanacetum coccineum TaxID=301880 RepID=A0ABQ5JCE2_9ASTR
MAPTAAMLTLIGGDHHPMNKSTFSNHQAKIAANAMKWVLNMMPYYHHETMTSSCSDQTKGLTQTLQDKSTADGLNKR